MDFLAPVLNGFGVVLEPTNLLYCLIGVVIGMLIGVLPGLGPAATIAILLPLTYGVEPVTAIIMLAGIFYGAQYGGTITSVLLRLPGEASSVVTVFDGYALARQGKAGTALGIAAIGSFFGGTVSIIGLTLLAPIVAGFALDFGPPEYTALAMLGILLVATVSNGSRLKSIIAASLGLLLATVGRDTFTGDGALHLRQPVPRRRPRLRADRHGHLRPRRNPLQPRGTAQQGPGAGQGGQRLALPQGPEGILRRDRPRLAARASSSGILPGGGATIASLAAYAMEKKRAKNPERFGRGAVEGVAAPETRQQRRRDVVVHSAADPRHSRQRHHGHHLRRAADPGRHARPAARDRATRSCSGAWSTRCTSATSCC